VYLVYRLFHAVGWLKLGLAEDEDPPGTATDTLGEEPEEEDWESWDPARWGNFLALVDSAKTVAAAIVLMGSVIRTGMDRTGSKP
jgi:hypothetical protein